MDRNGPRAVCIHATVARERRGDTYPRPTVVWAEADYYFVARDRNREMLTYTEGDVSRGDSAVR